MLQAAAAITWCGCWEGRLVRPGAGGGSATPCSVAALPEASSRGPLHVTLSLIHDPQPAVLKRQDHSIADFNCRLQLLI